MRTESNRIAIDDPLIDEVRAIRRDVCEEVGNDVDRLADVLREVEEQFNNRTGPYANVSADAAERVMAGWGDER